MGRTTLIEIDGLKLENAILSRGITMRYASNELGYSDWFLSNCKSRNTINKAAATGLANRFGIQLDEYKKDQEPEIVRVIEDAQKEAEPSGTMAVDLDYEKLAEALAKVCVIDYQKLYATIFKAVYEAEKKAWSNNE